MHLLNPMCSFADTKGFILLYIWMIFESSFALCMQKGGYDPFCASYWFAFGYKFNFQSLNFTLLSTFVFGDYVEIPWICLYVHLKKQQLTVLDGDSVCYSPSGHILLGQDQFLYQLTCTTSPIMSCHSE